MEKHLLQDGNTALQESVRESCYNFKHTKKTIENNAGLIPMQVPLEEVANAIKRMTKMIKELVVRELPALFYSNKDYMVDTFLFNVYLIRQKLKNLNIFTKNPYLFGLDMGKINICGVILATRCPLVLAVFFSF